MSERVFIRIRDFDLPIDWGILADGADSFVRQGQLETLDQLDALVPEASGRQVVVICPTHWATLTQAEVPVKQQRQMMKALPYMLEEHLTQDVDHFHFAPGLRIDNDTLGVLCIERDIMQRLEAAFQQAAIYPSYMTPEVLLLPYEPAHWTALIEGDYIAVRDGEFSGYAMEKTAVRDILSFAWETTEEDARPTKLHMFVEDFLVAGTIADDLPEDLEKEQTNCLSPLLMLAQNYKPGMTNLLQGEYSRTDRVLQQLKLWKPVGALVAMSLIIQVIVAGVDVHKMNGELEQLKAQKSQVFKDIVPGGTPYRMKGQVEQRIGSLRGGGASSEGFLQMLVKLESGFKANRGVTPLSFNFEGKRNELRLDLSAGSYQMLEQFKKAVEAEGLVAELGSANQRDNAFIGRMSIRSES